MVEQKLLSPGETYLLTKEILSINVWFPNNQQKWAIETGRRNLAIFLLPVGRILNFTIVKSKIHVLIQFHNKEVLEKVPRECKDQVYVLTSDEQDKYVAGELAPIAKEGSKTYLGDNLNIALRKRFANFLQSFTIQYNQHYGRKDRLSARYTGIFHLETDEAIRKVLTEVQNTPLIFDDKRDLENCNTNCYNIEDREVQRVISYQKIIDLFGGNLGTFQEAVKAVRMQLKVLQSDYKYLRKIAPGNYLRTG